MKHSNIALALAVTTALACQATRVQAAETLATSYAGSDATQVKINCNNDGRALKNALERKNWTAEKVRFVISGQCYGPLLIDRNGVEIVNDARKTGSVRVNQPNADQAAILVLSAAARLSNFNVDVPAGVAAVKARANATVAIDQLTTNAKSDADAPLGHVIATDSSSLFLSNLTGIDVLVIGASSADFEANNNGVGVDVRDTSSAKSSAANKFRSVLVTANGYFLGDNKTRIDTLGIWGKASVEVTRESSVGTLDMGGQTMFAAYKNSSVSGPYGIYGNVVFELEHSSATGWYTVNNPHSLFIGNGATVNSVLYPEWSWVGQGL
ncbi:hypothetical protein IGB42_01573 [Andreprevotia sp. IGB-42]|uniref:hypothetical protein n=1 Tax=Andreprevotia sp. IGB-42 TaxID=2497473 RepID=UPI00135C6E20|nr:hypothetical protein [Andreprevotia sp. IGB-42]KAF0813894.1 hypothetical protein IGB42_01573 [Andreprevotia sp. IGB-42]